MLRDGVCVVGCGYAGVRLVGSLRSQGVDVFATARTARTVAGVAVHALDLDAPEPAALPPHDVLIYLAPPQPDGDSDRRSERLVTCLQELPPVRAVVYVSTTGVYGECEGAWVDETTPLRPSTARAQRRVAAERVWRAAAETWQVPLAVLRVAGIYGPGRLPLSRLASGEPLLQADKSPYTNRIHVDDLVTALQSVIGLNETVDVADGAPLRLTAFYHALADASGRTRLVETDDVARVPAVRAGFGESRRVRAARLRSLVSLRHPTVFDGIRASLG
ncbi:MAG: NAD-dependent epimerase/dehydratase family protein [Pseudomonadota bacterium]